MFRIDGLSIDHGQRGLLWAGFFRSPAPNLMEKKEWNQKNPNHARDLTWFISFCKGLVYRRIFRLIAPAGGKGTCFPSGPIFARGRSYMVMVPPFLISSGVIRRMATTSSGAWRRSSETSNFQIG